MAQGQTKITNLFDPEVLGDMLNEQTGKHIKFAPLADVDKTLEGTPGDTLTVPQWNYIGDAAEVAEGAAIPVEQLGHTTTKMKVKKAAKGVEITDEALLSGYGDPKGTAVRQLAKSIDQKVDQDVLEAARTATQSVTTKKGLKIEDINAAQNVLNSESDDDVYVLLCNTKYANDLRLEAGKDFLSGTQLGAEAFVKGTYGAILNTQIVKSNKLLDTEAILVLTNKDEEDGTKAFKIVSKRDTLLEIERYASKKSTGLFADRHYGAYLQNAKKVVKIAITK